MGPDASAPDRVLAVEDVSVTLGGRLILDRIGFEVGRGEFCGLIGSNGAGKTTLFQVILGLLRPDTGQVRVDGRPIGGRSRSIGYVPQKVVLDPDLPLRARDFVAMGIDGHRFGLRRRSAPEKARVEEMIASVDAEAFADARVGRLSGGETQRILVAHALVGRPDLLLLDEPLANLDLRAGQEIVSLLHRIRTDQQVAVLLSAHEMNQLLPVMDRVVYLAGGRAASGRTGEVIRTEVLSRLYGHPVQVVNVAGRVLVVAGS
jgi:zinc/manganese transport system ATP-binding protein